MRAAVGKAPGASRGWRRAASGSVAFSLVYLAAIFAQPLRAVAFTFDDIEFWTGSGANRAAIVIDWSDVDVSQPALAWGFRWDGAATGSDLLRAVATADDRLFAKLGGTLARPTALYGAGYDTNDDGAFALDDGTTFDSAGLALSAPADAAMSVDAGDAYAEGWFLGFWHYAQASANPYQGGVWKSAPAGMANRVLVDGGWDGWTFTPSFSFTAFPANPIAAPSPFAPGDFDRDGAVTMADYSLWKVAFGSTTALAADGNGNGAVDAADYAVWRDHVGEVAVHAAPEPSSSALAVVVFAGLAWQLVSPRKEKFS